MIGKPIALLQVPNQRLFGPQAAAEYLGIHVQTLRKLADMGEIRALRMCGRRVFTLDELNRYIDSLPSYNDSANEESGRERRPHGYIS